MAYKKNVIANYVGQFYLITISIFIVPFYMKYMGAEAYGLVSFFALIQGWMLLLDMGISPTLIREVAKVRAEKSIDPHFKSLFHSLEFIFIGVSLVSAVTIVLSSGWISHHWLNVETLALSDVAYCIALIGIMVGLRFITALYKSGIIGTEQQVWLNQANIMIVTLKFVGSLFVLKYISRDFVYFFEYQMVITLVEFFIFSLKFYQLMGIGRFKVYFSYEAVKPILSFAISIAYTGGIWIVITQLDKLLLSTLLPLKEYGYFALVGMITNAIIQLSEPVSKAILPRMTSLHAQHKEGELIALYKNSTQIVAIIIFSVVGVISVYAYELLYSWTGNLEASLWAKDVLFWYVLANGILALSAFQYYIQFAYGDLKMHVRYHTLLIFILPPFIAWAAYMYSAIGVAVLWFVFMLLSFLLWIPMIHHKFIPGVHKSWMVKDVLPILFSTLLYFVAMHSIGISFTESRMFNFIELLLIGSGVLVTNVMASSVARGFINTQIKDRFLAKS